MTLPAALKAAASLAADLGESGEDDGEDVSDLSDEDQGEGLANGHDSAAAAEKRKKAKKKKGKKGRLGGRGGGPQAAAPAAAALAAGKGASSAAAQALAVVQRAAALRLSARRVLATDAHPLWPRVLKLAVDASAAAAAALEDQDAAAQPSAATAATAAACGSAAASAGLEARPPFAPRAVPPPGELEAVLALFLSASRRLGRFLARGLAGEDHPDLASTHHDLADGLKALLRRQPAAFALAGTAEEGSRAAPHAAGEQGAAPSDDDDDDDDDDEAAFPPPEWASVGRANQAEQRERRSHERVRALYVGR
jgi:hypothetical protein